MRRDNPLQFGFGDKAAACIRSVAEDKVKNVMNESV
jgi:hypothetical protein